MTEAVLMKRELDPGKVGRLRAWFEELDDREDEVIETLEDEGPTPNPRFCKPAATVCTCFTTWKSRTGRRCGRPSKRPITR